MQVQTIMVAGGDEAFARWCMETFPEAAVWQTDGPEHVVMADGSITSTDTLRQVYGEGV